MRNTYFTRSVAVGLTLLVGGLTGEAAQAQSSCIDGNVASAQPAGPLTLGALQPGVSGQIPDARDSTNYTGQQLPNFRYPLFTSLDIENGYVFMSYSFGLQIWDARGSNQADPIFLGSRDGFRCNEWLDWPTPCNSAGEARWVVWDVDAPKDNDNVVAFSGDPPASLSIWDTTNKSNPTAKYQDTAAYMKGVYAASINGRDYAFATGDGTRGVSGISVYDMTTAKNLGSPCVDTNGGHSCGVWVNRFGGTNAAFYVDGFRRSSDGKNFLAVSAGTSVRGLELWDISNPAAAVNLHGSGGRFMPTTQVHGVATWGQGNSSFLGAWIFSTATNQYVGQIYNISSCLAGGCTDLPAPITILQAAGPIATANYYLTYSEGNGTSYLYFGHDGKCLSGLQKEWLWDVSVPTAPVEITPDATITVSNQTEGPTQVDYWSYAYASNPNGFSQLMPRVGKFSGNWFYRAAWTLFDTHQRVNVAPQVQVTGPTTGYDGAAVNFTSTGLNCTPSSNGWSWSATGGGTGGGSTSAASFTWATPGNYTVTASNSACGNATGSANVQILASAPATSGVVASPTTATVCTPITFTAQNVTGRPTITYAWRVLQSGDDLPGVTGTTNPFVWTTSGVLPGTYDGEVTISNGFGSPAVASGTVTLTALPALPGAGSFTPTNNAFTAGTVQFHVTAAGATEWNWDFGDGPTGWVSDPTSGPNPIHTYTTTGQRSVTVQVRNCQSPSPVASAALAVNITQIAPLVAHFSANGCSFGLCAFATGQTVSFTNDSSGVDGTSQYFYDWSHTGTDANSCSFAGGSSTPSSSRVFSTAGTFTPCLKVTRGAENDVYVHSPSIIISSVAPPPTASISISGASSGTPNQVLTFTGSASNCTAGATGWTWGIAGGTVTGASNASSIQIAWSSTGSKSLTARNSGCSGATGTKTVSIASTSGLTANFTTTPANPAPGATITFDGASSMGNIATYSWSFPGNVFKNGTQVTHVFPTAGTYSVLLQVSAPGCGVSSCTSASVTKQVVVGGTGLAVSYSSPACALGTCAGTAGQEISFASTTVGATTFNWNFGDGGTSSVANPTHTFASTGSFTVSLTAGDGTTSGSTSKAFVITAGNGLTATFTSPACTLAGCAGATGQVIAFTSTSNGATTFNWTFGDGQTSTAANPSHTFAAGGTFTVTLTTGNGTNTASTSKVFTITGPVTPANRAVLLPWIAQTTGALVQSSDLYIYNPGTTTMDTVIRFLKRGIPEPAPPEVRRQIAPGATLYLADVVGDLFDRANLAGFLFIEPQGTGTTKPSVTSFNRTFQDDGRVFGQVVIGVELPDAAASTVPAIQHLVGLNDNAERSAYFGISNPNGSGASYNLKLFDANGDLLAQTTEALTIAANGQKQFQVEEIRSRFGVEDQDDYRVQVESTAGGPLFPYGANLRLSSSDPAFVRPGRTGDSEIFLVGALSTQGLNNSLFKTDLVLTNTSVAESLTEITFTPVGASSIPTDTVTLTLQPGETRRIVDILNREWALTNVIGVLRVLSDNTAQVYPVVQGETYDAARDNERYGQAMPPLTAVDAATPGKARSLVGLRQDAEHRTTLWVFNPGNQSAEYTLSYRALDGTVLGSTAGLSLGPGKLRQISPSQHPFGAGGVVAGAGFTVEVVVQTGKVLAAAQVVNAANDPAYITGQ